MALGLEAFYTATFNLVDSLGKTTTRTFEKGLAGTDTMTIDDIVAEVVALWTEFDPLTLSVPSNISITLNYRESSVTVPGAGLNSDNAEMALPLVGRPNTYGKIAIPNPASAIFVATSGTGAQQVDPNDSDVQAFLGMFDAATGWLVSDRENLIDFNASLFKGKRVSVRSR